MQNNLNCGIVYMFSVSHWRPKPAAILTVFAIGALTIGGCSKPANSKSKVVDVAEVDAEFGVPDGEPDKILKFIKQMHERASKRQDTEDTLKTWKALIDAGDKLLAGKASFTQPVSDEVLREGADAKLAGILLPLLHPLEESAVNDTSVDGAIKAVDELRRDKRPAVATTADGYWIPTRALKLPWMSEAEKQELADDAVKRAVTAKLSPEAIGEVQFVADHLTQAGDKESAFKLLERLAQKMSESSDNRARANASKIRSQIKRMRLLGHEIELKGRLLEGGELDWASYRGKVVLVDFWATWCGPCIGELPNVKANYQQYHDQGFEVIGISLDNERQSLERFLKQEALPWAQVFDDRNKAELGWQNPLAQKLGVSSIPAAFLIDKDGKVVSLQARGTELGRLLKKMLSQ